MRVHSATLAVGIVLAVGLWAAPLGAQSIRLVERRPDPHAAPRPWRAARDVPLRTSLYFELSLTGGAADDRLVPDSVTLRLEAATGQVREVLRTGQQFSDDCEGWVRPRQGGFGSAMQGAPVLAVYAELAGPLDAQTLYTAHVSARSRKGIELADSAASWSFTTEPVSAARRLAWSLDLAAEPVQWRGAFFSGLCNIVFCTSAQTFGPTYDLMNEARQRHPRAWSLQRDFWMTGTEDRAPGWFGSHLPHIVRERQTRRITALEESEAGTLLCIEDFFGHEQYGIPSNRPVGEDYHPGDEVLIADGVHDARATVIEADSEARTVLVSRVASPPGGWKIEYTAPLPKRENPDAPGLFPPGGCYLRKFKPHDTPVYYWGRLDKEWDHVHRVLGRRLMPNFADAPGDLSLDGRSWTSVKDHAQWHDVVRAITGHIIDRYGDAALTFTWSVFNEPDLGRAFWRTDWDELQRFYDYTVDGILRAFEDRGYDSNRVFVGGLELGGIFGVNLKLREFLAHCSPRAQAKGALELNAAFADTRLEGRRSRRVEELCRASGGKGSPCDFVSVHAYNDSQMMAAKLIAAKKLALEMDAEYYADLWVNSHESCPEWNLPPDPAAADVYLGNGYFPGWCVDVAGRLLHQASRDPRYAFGETLLTVWPPPANFAGLNAVTRILQCDDDGDGRADRSVTIPMPIFHVLTLLSDFGPRYWVLPFEQVGGHVVSGFASRDDSGTLRILLYSHHAQDTQSRSQASFDVELDITALGWEGPARIREHRFDTDHNSYFHQARALGNPRGALSREQVEQFEELARLKVTSSALRPRTEGDPQRRAYRQWCQHPRDRTRPRGRRAAMIARRCRTLPPPGRRPFIR
jgi:hypothetical protein